MIVVRPWGSNAGLQGDLKDIACLLLGRQQGSEGGSQSTFLRCLQATVWLLAALTNGSTYDVTTVRRLGAG